jgi:photosystem II stability/assembly factor-like uncharacterized protein
MIGSRSEGWYVLTLEPSLALAQNAGRSWSRQFISRKASSWL